MSTNRVGAGWTGLFTRNLGARLSPSFGVLQRTSLEQTSSVIVQHDLNPIRIWNGTFLQGNALLPLLSTNKVQFESETKHFCEGTRCCHCSAQIKSKSNLKRNISARECAAAMAQRKLKSISNLKRNISTRERAAAMAQHELNPIRFWNGIFLQGSALLPLLGTN